MQDKNEVPSYDKSYIRRDFCFCLYRLSSKYLAILYYIHYLRFVEVETPYFPLLVFLSVLVYFKNKVERNPQ